MKVQSLEQELETMEKLRRTDAENYEALQSQLNNVTNSMSIERSSLSEEIEILKTDLARSRESEAKLVEGLESKQKMLTLSDEEISRLKNELKEHHQQTASLLEEKMQQQQKVDALELDLSRLRSELEKAEAAAEETIQNLDGRILDMSNEIAGLNSEVNTLNNCLEEERAMISKLNKELEEYQQQMTSLSSDKMQKQHMVDTLERELSGLRSKLEKAVSAAEETKTSLDGRILGMAGEISDLNAKVDTLTSSLDEERTVISRLNSELDTKSAEFSSMVAQHQEQVVSLNFKINQSDNTVLELRAHLAEERAALTSIRSELTALESTLQSEKMAHEQTEGRAKNLEGLLDAEKDAHMLAESKVEELSSLLSVERDSVTELHSRLDSLSNDYTTEKEAHSSTQSLADSFKEQLESERHSHLQSRASLADLSAENDSIKREKDELSVHFDKVSEQLAGEISAHVLIQTRLSEARSALDEERSSHGDTRVKLAEVCAVLDETTAARVSAQQCIAEMTTSLASERDALEKAKLESLEQKKSFSEFYKEQKNKIALLTTTLNEEMEKSHAKDERITLLSGELAVKTGEFEGMQLELKTMEERNTQTAASNQSQLELLKEKVAELQSRNQQLCVEAEDREARFRSLESEIQAIRLRSANDIGRKDESIRELKERLAIREREADDLRASIEGVENVKTELKRAQLEAENIKGHAATERLLGQEKIDVVLAQNAALRVDNQRLEEARDELEREKAALEDERSSEVEFLKKYYKTAYDDLKKLSSDNANLAGHKNNQQKIKYVVKIREDLRVAKEMNTKLECERDRLRKRNMNLERDLEAYKIVPVGSAVKPAHIASARESLASASVLADLTLDEASISSNATNAGTSKRSKMSRVGRAFLAARDQPQPPLPPPQESKRAVREVPITIAPFGRQKENDGVAAVPVAAENASFIVDMVGFDASSDAFPVHDVSVIEAVEEEYDEDKENGHGSRERPAAAEKVKGNKAVADVAGGADATDGGDSGQQLGSRRGLFFTVL